MTYSGVAKRGVIELEGNVALADGTRVSVVIEPPAATSLRAWLEGARQLRAQLPVTTDSVDILRQLRDQRASR